MYIHYFILFLFLFHFYYYSVSFIKHFLKILSIKNIFKTPSELGSYDAVARQPEIVPHA